MWIVGGVGRREEGEEDLRSTRRTSWSWMTVWGWGQWPQGKRLGEHFQSTKSLSRAIATLESRLARLGWKKY